MFKPTIICLTPVKNEDWILDKFLKCASLWADHIIIADQNSTDKSREIAKSYPKVILVENKSEFYDEFGRQKLLLAEARRIGSQRLLITLDADEFFTPNFMNSQEWDIIMNTPPGTIIKFQWVNIKPDLKTYWIGSNNKPLGFMDDGSEHKGNRIHSPRIPISSSGSQISLRDIKVMHYQYTDWDRAESKHRWYQCLERVNNPKRSAISIYRQYHHMYGVKDSEIKNIPKEWFEGYKRLGINITDIHKNKSYWYDSEVLKYIDEYGAQFFRKEDIWDIDWVERAKLFGYKNPINFKDPRTIFERIIHRWLRKTQKYAHKMTVKCIEKAIKRLGW